MKLLLLLSIIVSVLLRGDIVLAGPPLEPFPPFLIGKSWQDLGFCPPPGGLTIPVLKATLSTIDLTEFTFVTVDELSCGGDDLVLYFRRQPRKPVIERFIGTTYNLKTSPNASCRGGKREKYFLDGNTRPGFENAFRQLYNRLIKIKDSNCKGEPDPSSQQIVWLLGYMRTVAYNHRIQID